MATYSGVTINNTLTLLSNYANSINEKTDFVKAKNKFINDLTLIKIMLKEFESTINFSNYSIDVSKFEREMLNQNLTSMILDSKNAKTSMSLKEINQNKLNMYKDLRFEEAPSYKLLSWVDYLSNDIHDENREELGALDSYKIMNSININRQFNIFSPRCARGVSLERLAKDKDAITYGLEKRSCQSIAKEKLTRVIKGELEGSKISNDCFDIMHIYPAISWLDDLGATGNLLEKKEKAYLRNTIKYLRKDGILIYTIPVTRCTKDMAFIFSKLLRDVQVIVDSNSDGLPYIHIMGVKDITKEARQDIYKYLSEIPLKDTLPTEFTFKYDLPSGGIKTPELFRGSVLDESELEDLINRSGLLSSFWKQHEIEDKDNNMKPLLPFNMGQIGLVLTSGCLDGVVEEYDGQYHAIKGMVTKIRDVNNTIDNGNETSIETISNKVQINLLTPDGKFIELA